jgi:hypothetical protein
VGSGEATITNYIVLGLMGKHFIAISAIYGFGSYIYFAIIRNLVVQAR